MVRDEKANPDIGALPRVFDKTPDEQENVSDLWSLLGNDNIKEVINIKFRTQYDLLN